MPVLLVISVTLLASLVAPALARASSVAMQPVRYCTDSWSDCRYMDFKAGVVLRYAGAPGERNRVAVSRDGATIVVADSGAPLAAGSGCVTVDRHTALCVVGAEPLAGFRLDGGDGDDVLEIRGRLAPVQAVIEPRMLLGGPGADELLDGGDASTLLGGPGRDRLRGGEGDDRLLDAADYRDRGGRDDAASDDVHGGPGTDTADYRARRADLRLRLAGPAPGGGERGEHDVLHSIEVVLGGRRDDRIAGGPGDERLEGNGGDDVLLAGGGDDELIGGLGSDVLDGGAGNDRVGSGPLRRGDAPDRVSCGPGADIAGELIPDDGFSGDTWLAPNDVDVLALDCEAVPFFAGFDVDPDTRVDPRPRRHGRSWTFANPCAELALRPCRGRIELALRAIGTFARAGFASTGAVRVRLTAGEGRRVRRAGRVLVRISLREERRFAERHTLAVTLAVSGG